MNKKNIITTPLSAVLALTSCHHSAQKAEAEQQADSTEAVANADTLQLVIGGFNLIIGKEEWTEEDEIWRDT